MKVVELLQAVAEEERQDRRPVACEMDAVQLVELQESVGPLVEGFAPADVPPPPPGSEGELFGVAVYVSPKPGFRFTKFEEA